MGQYLIDNNVISHYFSELLSENGMLFIAQILDQTPNVSVITEIEALSWVNPDKSKEALIREFISDANVFPLTPAIVKSCVKIRRNRKIKTPDAIIAATAIVHNLILISNDDHFKGIEGLQLIDSQSL
ncbi:type II toxin-antitoxin system VapC family toxin [Dyadobacter sp. CY312]|uniref:type II toxin-antitoxin system VapC family toxin n=1 Tax=Dyadobacter sp. CY312 TaxID=2907303 RepID=UPI001F387AD9|nr:type II toxin-antitoxin system VapC family toxin [Dyadobacter sp. CY312]MCE7042994.1 type II toxin-antitoxin system VapC family toxin [Dyadobacter sp. CY312]